MYNIFSWRYFEMNDELFLNERVEVVAIFGNGLNPCKPVRFKRANGREVDITEIGLYTEDETLVARKVRDRIKKTPDMEFGDTWELLV